MPFQQCVGGSAGALPFGRIGQLLVTTEDNDTHPLLRAHHLGRFAVAHPRNSPRNARNPLASTWPGAFPRHRAGPRLPRSVTPLVGASTAGTAQEQPRQGDRLHARAVATPDPVSRCDHLSTSWKPSIDSATTSTAFCLYMNTENDSEWGSRSHIHVLALMAATALGIYLCYLMALPFLPALTWALALAVLFMPVHRWLESTMKRPNLAASVSVLVIGLIVVVPATFMGQRLVSEAVTGADTIRAKVESGEWQRVLDGHPRVAPIAQRIERQIDLPGTISTIAAWLTNATASFVRGSVIQAIERAPDVLSAVLFPARPARGAPVAPLALASLRGGHGPAVQPRGRYRSRHGLWNVGRRRRPGHVGWTDVLVAGSAGSRCCGDW